MMYYMDWVLTNAQIALLSADVSVVDYGLDKDKKKRKKGEFDDTKADAAEVRKASESWLERYGSGERAGSGLAIGDILGGNLKKNVGIKLK